MPIAAKRPDVSSYVAHALKNDIVRFSDHAMQRMDERLHEFGLDEIDVFRVLGKGRAKRKKTSGMTFIRNGIMHSEARLLMLWSCAFQLH